MGPNQRLVVQSRGGTLARTGDRGRIVAPVMRLVKAAEEPDQHQNWNRHPKQPQKHIASHRRSSLFAGELEACGQVPDTLLQCEHWNECIVRGLTLAMENERSKWRTKCVRGKSDEPESKPKARPTAAGRPTAGWPGETRPAAARWAAEARPAAAGRSAEPAESLVH